MSSLATDPARIRDEIPSEAAIFGVLRLPRTVLFGAGQRRSVGEIAAGLGSNILVCTDARLGGSAELAELTADLDAAGVAVHVFDRTEPELPVAGIMDCLAEIAHRPVDAVLALGGGSCIDMGKVVALLLAHGGTPADFYGENNVPGPTVPVIAIPTTAGTGSEVTPVAVVSDPERAMKVGISSPYLVPHAAVCDPELTYTCPASLTAASGIDAVVHMVESFTAIKRPATADLSTTRVFVGKSLFSDQAAREGLTLMGRSLLTAQRQPGNATARSDVMMGSLLGGIAMATGGTSAAHALQYPIGSATHTPHGYGVGALLPYVTRFNLPARVPEFATIAQALGVATGTDPWRDAVTAIERLDALVDGLAVPSIAELGVKKADLAWIAEQGLQARRLVDNNPVPLDVTAMLSIVTRAFQGDRTIPDPPSSGDLR
ncbi:iron-containing alcohol dehydrogenase [Mycobacterium sp. AMU20-3851]|uniref:iron-containing alcohol dehydrogenase n=1 Tax=Mycobacterium sp. AMU20-3851 TaxID=3122055 RepID=UPI003754B6B0